VGSHAEGSFLTVDGIAAKISNGLPLRVPRGAGCEGDFASAQSSLS
jgi:hypothetical protein